MPAISLFHDWIRGRANYKGVVLPAVSAELDRLRHLCGGGVEAEEDGGEDPTVERRRREKATASAMGCKEEPSNSSMNDRWHFFYNSEEDLHDVGLMKQRPPGV